MIQGVSGLIYLNEKHKHFISTFDIKYLLICNCFLKGVSSKFISIAQGYWGECDAGENFIPDHVRKFSMFV
jgi:hypothetical protein